MRTDAMGIGRGSGGWFWYCKYYLQLYWTSTRPRCAHRRPPPFPVHNGGRNCHKRLPPTLRRVELVRYVSVGNPVAQWSHILCLLGAPSTITSRVMSLSSIRAGIFPGHSGALNAMAAPIGIYPAAEEVMGFHWSHGSRLSGGCSPRAPCRP